VVVVDDDYMVARVHSAFVGRVPGCTVVATASDGAEAVEAVLRYRPDLVLMDLRMPGVDGIAATSRIAAQADAPPVVALTTFDGDEHVHRALRAGAAGYLLKSTPPDELVGLVRVAAQGHTVLSRSAAQRLVGRSASQASEKRRAVSRLESLTDREREVVALLGEGCSNAEVARRLFLTEATVKGYVSRALDKVGASNRTQLGLLAREAGLTG
jgi:DNA-binding NarL/FixJ family response regulator